MTKLKVIFDHSASGLGDSRKQRGWLEEGGREHREWGKGPIGGKRGLVGMVGPKNLLDGKVGGPHFP